MFAYQVTDKPATWLRVIAPEDTLEVLEADLREQFGGRFVAVRADSWRAVRDDQ